MNIKPGDRFNNKKGELCQVVAIAKDDNDLTTKLVYQVLAGNYEVRTCTIGETASTEPEKPAAITGSPAALESSKDNSKAEEAVVADSVEETKTAENVNVADGEVKEIFEGEVNPDLLAFLEADSVDEKLEVIYNIKDTEDERLLSAIEASLDITASGGTPEERIYFIRQILLTRAKFEGSRLR